MCIRDSYNPKDGVAQTDINLAALYDIKTEKDLSEFDTPLADEYGG